MAEGKKPKKKGLMIALIIVFVLLATAGTVFGLAFTGKINIPGITKPKPKKVTKPKAKPAAKPKAKPKPKEEPTVAPVATNKVVDKEGCAKLAAVWGEMDAKALLKVSASWKAVELAPVLVEMDEAKVAELLAAMETKKAAETSREMRRLASIVPITE